MAEQRINQHLALEMTMQEVLGNLEELSLDFGYSDGEDCFEIVAIEPCEVPGEVTQRGASALVRPPFEARTASLLYRVA